MSVPSGHFFPEVELSMVRNATHVVQYLCVIELADPRGIVSGELRALCATPRNKENDEKLLFHKLLEGENVLLQ